MPTADKVIYHSTLQFSVTLLIFLNVVVQMEFHYIYACSAYLCLTRHFQDEIEIIACHRCDFFQVSLKSEIVQIYLTTSELIVL
jgi:hypothetical protein